MATELAQVLPRETEQGGISREAFVNQSFLTVLPTPTLRTNQNHKHTIFMNDNREGVHRLSSLTPNALHQSGEAELHFVSTLTNTGTYSLLTLARTKCGSSKSTKFISN